VYWVKRFGDLLVWLRFSFPFSCYLLVGHTHEDVDRVSDLLLDVVLSVSYLVYLPKIAPTSFDSVIYETPLHEKSFDEGGYHNLQCLDPGQNHTSLPLSIVDPLSFFVSPKLAKVKWKYCTIFWLVTSKRSVNLKKNNNNKKQKHTHYHERCASWVSNFTQTRKWKNFEGQCYGQTNGSPQFMFDWGWHECRRSFTVGERESRAMWKKITKDECMENREWLISTFKMKFNTVGKFDEHLINKCWIVP